MFRISKRFSFSAAHRLLNLPEGHPCGVLHGHNYEAELIFESPRLDDRGFAHLDYRELDVVKRWIDKFWDHRTIISNRDPIWASIADEQPFLLDCNPSAENLARILFTVANELLGESQACLRAVRISETPKTVAEYSE